MLLLYSASRAAGGHSRLVLVPYHTGRQQQAARGAIYAYYVISIFAMLLLHSAVGNRLWPVRSHVEASLVQKPEQAIIINNA